MPIHNKCKASIARSMLMLRPIPNPHHALTFRNHRLLLGSFHRGAPRLNSLIKPSMSAAHTAVLPPQSGILMPLFRFRSTSMIPHLSSHCSVGVLYLTFQGSSKASNLRSIIDTSSRLTKPHNCHDIQKRIPGMASEKAQGARRLTKNIPSHLPNSDKPNPPRTYSSAQSPPHSPGWQSHKQSHSQQYLSRSHCLPN